METYDPEKAARVWQRVQGNAAETHGHTEAAPDFRGLPALIAGEFTDAATYLALARRFQGKQSVLLRQMAQEEQTHAACLKGIYTLITGSHPAVSSVQPDTTSVSATLRRCYGREMRCLAEYEARSSDPEYGQVFSRLAVQEREHCRRILELLGSLQDTRKL